MKTKLIVLLIVTLMAKIQAQNAKIPYLLTSLYERQIENNLQETIIINSVETQVYNSFFPQIADYLNIDLSDPDPIVRALIMFNDVPGNLESIGVTITSHIDNIYSVRFPISILPSLASADSLIKIELGMPVSTELDKSSVKVKADLGRQTSGFDGENTIVSIIDTGIDIFNEDFKNNDGSTRIKYIWDQLGTGNPPSGWDYGTIWTSSQINAGSCTHRDNHGHGTHVAGIAAGNGRATGNGQPSNTYTGMAPKSDLVIVSLDFSNYANIIDGLSWIADKSISLGKPWVANLSLGINHGPKDGTTLFESGISTLVGDLTLDYGEGRIIVISAGNRGYNPSDPYKDENDKWHSGNLSSGNATFTVNSTTWNDQEFFWIQIWYPHSDIYSITITSPNNNQYGPIFTGGGSGTPGQGYVQEDDGFIGIHNEHFGNADPYPLTEDRFIEVLIGDFYTTIDGTVYEYDLANGDWTITMSASGGGRWDAYIPYHEAVGQGVYFTDDSYENARILNEPGNAFNTLTVGSMNTNSRGNDSAYPLDQISYFSSLGPTRDGRIKPEIFAPGAFIASSLSEEYKLNNNEYSSSNLANDNTHYYMKGTSMSAPHVTGAVALLLDMHPNWGIDDIKSRLIETANTQYGYNLLNIHAALCEDNMDCDQNPASPYCQTKEKLDEKTELNNNSHSGGK